MAYGCPGDAPGRRREALGESTYSGNGRRQYGMAASGASRRYHSGRDGNTRNPALEVETDARHREAPIHGAESARRSGVRGDAELLGAPPAADNVTASEGSETK